jgi:vancomycin resistance protein VanW
MGAATTLRRMARRAVPLGVRQAVAHARRVARDRASGLELQRARGGQGWPVAVELAQAVLPTSTLRAKLLNLRRGASLVDASVVEPGGTWSFWDRIGRPSARNGFAPGRNLVEGRLVRQPGGGLCQLSSLLYHLGLLGGLEVAERHAHSIDIYREEERYAPLGADATVVWGFKDLRLRNPHPFAVSIACRLDGHRLVGQLRCDGVIGERCIGFTREPAAPGRVRVWTVIDGVQRWETEYERRAGLEIA